MNPDQALEDVERLLHERIEFERAIWEGEAQVDRGEVVPHEQVKREFKSWISK